MKVIIFSLLAVAAAIAEPTVHAPKTWELKVTFPAKPKSTKEAAPIPKGEMVTESASIGGLNSLLANRITFSRHLDKDDQTKFSEILKGHIVKRMGGELAEEKEYVVDGNRGKQFSIKSPDRVTTVIQVFVNEALFQFIASVKNDQTEVAKGFIESISENGQQGAEVEHGERRE